MKRNNLNIKCSFNNLRFILYSLIIHILIFALLHFLIFSDQQQSEDKETFSDLQTLNIKELRRVGIQESQSDKNILIDQGQPDAPEIPAPQEITPDTPPPPPPISLKDLGEIETDSKPKESKQSKHQNEQDDKVPSSQAILTEIGELQIQRDSTLTTPAITRETALDQLNLQRQIQRQMGTGNAAEVASRGQTFMRFDPPEGIHPDELNSIEKMFYGFQVRVFENYLRALMLSYNHLESKHPNLLQNLRSRSYRLSARVTFDREGNVMAVRVTRWTDQNDVQALFEESLKRINKIPNIPKDLIGDREEFNIYYILHIN